MRVRFLSPAPCDVAGHQGHREPASGSRCFLWPAGGAAGGLVVPGRVEGELAEEFAGAGVDDADVQVLGQEQDAGSAVGRPVPMWWRRPLWRRVTSPVLSMRSARTRSWVSAARSPGLALERAVQAAAGVARPGSDLCGRRVLQMPAKTFSRAWSSPGVAGWSGCAEPVLHRLLESSVADPDRYGPRERVSPLSCSGVPTHALTLLTWARSRSWHRAPSWMKAKRESAAGSSWQDKVLPEVTEQHAVRAVRRSGPSFTRSRARGPLVPRGQCRSTTRALPHATEMAQPAEED
jgi:hypothetical protein